MPEDEVLKRVTDICDRNRDALLSVVELLLRDREPVREPDSQAEHTRLMVERIKAKQFISPDEAAMLLGCSAQHLRNQVQKAIEGSATVPIPFRDLDGVVTFSIHELLEWSLTPKPRKVKSKNKAHLRVAAS